MSFELLPSPKTVNVVYEYSQTDYYHLANLGRKRKWSESTCAFCLRLNGTLESCLKTDGLA